MTAIIASFTVTATVGSMTEVAGAAPVMPPETTTVIENGAWSWFGNERAILSHDDTTLTVSAVVGPHSVWPASGTVSLVEVDLTSGDRRYVNLGRGEADDHNSASIWEAPTGELLTSWSRHHQDTVIRSHRRRTDRSWLSLPLLNVGTLVTYNNLLGWRTPVKDGSVLYNFYRGYKWDPSVLRSTDFGRSWENLGRLLRDPTDSPTARPYVNYTADGGRIDLIATENHPTVAVTSIYHGFIEDGLIHRSDGTAVGTLGSAVDVRSLTRVWTPTGSERAWTADVEIDPTNGMPVATFSVRHTVGDHRYWHARWNGVSWTAREIAYAGSALYPAEPDYTGLVALDPNDPDSATISTDVDPDDGSPLVSSSDGRQHHELFAGRRQPDGSFSWLPLTEDSTEDNLRPVLVAGDTGARALLWLRGRYDSFADFDLTVVGVVRRADGTAVAAGPAHSAGIINTLPVELPEARGGFPLVGRYDSHPADDLYLYRAGTQREQTLLGDDQRHPTPIRPRAANGVYRPLSGDYDGDGHDDIYWYGPGTAPDYLWLGNSAGTFTGHPARAVNGRYSPTTGDFDGDGHDDIYWYGPGTAPDYLWLGNSAGTFTGHPARAVNGRYSPTTGDFDGDGHDDIYWYGPGTAPDYLWLGNSAGTFTGHPARAVNGLYLPITGDFDGDGHDDIHWYAPGRAVDYLWWSASGPLAETSLYTNL